MLTPFGKFMRRIRIDRNESLIQMSKNLNISPSYLSILESGRRTVQPKMVELIIERYHLDSNQAVELQDVSVESNKFVEINLEEFNQAQKDLTKVFARKISEADPELIKKLQKVLEEE